MKRIILFVIIIMFSSCMEKAVYSKTYLFENYNFSEYYGSKIFDVGICSDCKYNGSDLLVFTFYNHKTLYITFNRCDKVVDKYNKVKITDYNFNNLKNKTISNIGKCYVCNESKYSDIIVFNFSDGSSFKIKYYKYENTVYIP